MTTETTTVIIFIAVTVLVVLVATTFVALIFAEVFGDGEDSVRDVQRFVDLTNEARALLPHGLPLFDPQGAAGATAAIIRFQAKKDEARKALWQSRLRPGVAGRVDSTDDRAAQPKPVSRPLPSNDY